MPDIETPRLEAPPLTAQLVMWLRQQFQDTCLGLDSQHELSFRQGQQSVVRTIENVHTRQTEGA